MAQVRLSAPAFTDIERIFEFYAEQSPAQALAQIQKIRQAIEILAEHPLMGHPAEDGRRELIISRGRYAYLALYRYRPSTEEVLVLRIRSAREAGYRDLPCRSLMLPPASLDPVELDVGSALRASQ